jgi:hypothetical protein
MGDHPSQGAGRGSCPHRGPVSNWGNYRNPPLRLLSRGDRRWRTASGRATARALNSTGVAGFPQYGAVYQHRMQDDEFEWHDAKAKFNASEHHVTFEAARFAFRDSRFIERLDPDESDEDRFLLTASTLAQGAVVDDNAYMAETVDNTLMLEILKELRKDVRDVRTVVLQLAEQNRRLERRFNELKDDLELMVKSELLGALTHFQNKIEIYVEQRLAEKAE